MKNDAMKRAMQRTSLTLALVLPVLMACATPTAPAAPAANEITLNMDWREGEATKHTVSVQFGIHGKIGHEKGQPDGIEKTMTYAGTYTRKISDHEKGLLVSFSDIEATAEKSDLNDFAPSRTQLAIGKISALLLVARPDFIMTPNGEFIALLDYDQYAADQRARMSDLRGLPKPDDETEKDFTDRVVGSFTRVGLSQALLEEQIEHDLALVKDIDQLILQLGKPIKTSITPAYTSKHTRNNKKGVK